MTGLEALVLVPLVYGCVHLGKKVLEQSRVINNQNALIDVQRQTIDVLQQQAPSSAAGSQGATWSGSALQRAAAWSGVAVAAGVVAYNTHRWILQSNQSSSTTAGLVSPTANVEPSDTYKPILATSEQDECRVCCEHQRDTLLLPCRHFALCWSCAKKILSSEDRKCPLCRGDIASAQFTFVV